MINFRVQNLENLVGELRNEGVTIVDTFESFNCGNQMILNLRILLKGKIVNT
jgi:hypothetical protein